MLGKQIQNYRIERLIGEGGMGNVYLAVHTHIGRQVAIKALNPTLAKNPEIRERFKNEASMLSQLHHPNIVQLYDYVEMDQGVFLIMEFADGQPLDEYIEKVTGPIPEEKALVIFNKILDGVTYAHKKNVVHRDIKPSNIIVNPEGMVKILDFGIAKIIGDTNHKLTKTGTKLGTVLYMSPEQVKGQDIDLHTDIYSLGITLFEMLTGKCPYDGSTSEYEVYKKIVEEPLPDPRSFYPGVSEQMVQVIAKATQKEVSSRYNDCQEFKQALLAPPVIVPDPQGKKKKEKKKKKEHPEPTRKVRTRFMERTILFWNVFIPMLLASFIVIAFLRIATLTDNKYVIANNLYLRSTRNMELESNRVKLLDFGDKLEIIDVDNERDLNGIRWARVKDAVGTEGFVATMYLGTYTEYDQIRQIFMQEALKGTDAPFKKAVRTYFLEHGYFDDNGSTGWHLYGQSGNPAYNDFMTYDFNNDSILDYVCIVRNDAQAKYLILAFLGTSSGDPDNVMELLVEDPSQIRVRPYGKKTQLLVHRTSDNVETRYYWSDEDRTFDIDK